MKNESSIGFASVANAVITGNKRGLQFLEHPTWVPSSTQNDCDYGLNATLRYRIVNNSRYCVVTVTGTIKVNTASELYDLVIRCVSNKQNVILCMSDILNIDTAGAAILFEAYIKARNQDQLLILVDVDPAVQRVLNLCGLNQILPVYESFLEAELRIRGEVPHTDRNQT